VPNDEERRKIIEDAKKEVKKNQRFVSIVNGEKKLLK